MDEVNAVSPARLIPEVLCSSECEMFVRTLP